MILGITAVRDGKVYLGDDYAGVGAIYSCVQKHRSGYAGSAIRVQRSSDSTQQDIGFDSDGLLDQTALTSFVGGGNGDVVTVYDQSGNGYDVTAAASQQWRIVTSGTVNTNGGQPTMVGGATASGFIINGGITSSDLGTYSAGEGDQTVLFVGALDAGGSYGYQLLDSTLAEEGRLFYRSSPNIGLRFHDEQINISGSIDTSGAVVEMYWDAGDDATYVYSNGISAGSSANDPTAALNVDYIIFGSGTSSNDPTELQELIIFNQSHYDSRTDVYALISEYYTY
jgi:hypothetical protein